jgi:serine/threonine-protein kinase
MELARAVSYIHARGVSHRDIKPSNVYVAARDGPLLFDFGFARSSRAGDAVPGGTPAYMAPEQLQAFLDPRAWDDVGPAADIYALGLTLVELVVGAPPEMPSGGPPGPRAPRALLSQRASPVWAARVAARGLPPGLGKIVRRCLAPAPEARYTDAGDVALELARSLARRRSRRPSRRRCAGAVGSTEGRASPRPSGREPICSSTIDPAR